MQKPIICVVGLGYVGLPLAVAFAEKTRVIGFDVDEDRVAGLKKGTDTTGEVKDAELKGCDAEFTSDAKRIADADFIIIAVPTPVDRANVPDLKYVRAASELVGGNMKQGSIIVYESTVYPGATEEECIPVLEKASGFSAGKGFSVGYSPERINPGDEKHTLKTIVKIVSGQDKKTLERVAEVYSMVVEAGVHKAPSIKVAEAAKVIENIQRDLNIALMNELSMIFDRLDIDSKDVLEAAGTKWNFHKYYPGLVGGHCIGVDPYYLTYKAQKIGYQPQIILAGRTINESMPKHLAHIVLKCLASIRPLNGTRVLLLGLTFKENVPDYRNSKAKELIEELKRYNVEVIACEPLLDKTTVSEAFGVGNYELSELKDGIDCAVLINPHKQFESLSLDMLKAMMGKKPILVDVRNFYDRKGAEERGFIYRSL